jgi:hypothetical protein
MTVKAIKVKAYGNFKAGIEVDRSSTADMRNCTQLGKNKMCEVGCMARGKDDLQICNDRTSVCTLG